VLESTRAKEANVKRETTEQLQAFRKQQEEAEKANRTNLAPAPTDTAETSWSTSARKRKKGRSEVLGGVKLRKTSSTDGPPRTKSVGAESREQDAGSIQHEDQGSEEAEQRAVTHIDAAQPLVKSDAEQPQADAKLAAPTLLGLGAYSSDEEEVD
jgi:hypothetical protein